MPVFLICLLDTQKETPRKAQARQTKPRRQGGRHLLSVRRNTAPKQTPDPEYQKEFDVSKEFMALTCLPNYKSMGETEKIMRLDDLHERDKREELRDGLRMDPNTPLTSPHFMLDARMGLQQAVDNSNRFSQVTEWLRIGELLRVITAIEHMGPVGRRPLGSGRLRGLLRRRSVINARKKLSQTRNWLAHNLFPDRQDGREIQRGLRKLAEAIASESRFSPADTCALIAELSSDTSVRRLQDFWKYEDTHSNTAHFPRGFLV